MGKIVGHCTVGWQVNEAQMAGLTHSAARRARTDDNHNDDYGTFTHIGFSMARQRLGKEL